MTCSDHSDSTPDTVGGDVTSDTSGVQPVLAAVTLKPGLYVVSTPIGHLRDITLRALDTLAACDEVLAEDTRQTRKLLDAYGVKAKVTPYHDHNGAERRPELIERLKAGAILALVSDAGTPLVSDPGFKLVRDSLESGVNVVPVPGASAPLAALVAAGLPSDRFLFAGFLPPKTAARQRELRTLASIEATLIFFESGPRLAASLADMASVLGASRSACVARELTKLFEEIVRKPLGELADHYDRNGPPKGEIVVLVGPPVDVSAGPEALDAALRDAMRDRPLKQAVSDVAEALGLPRRDVYQRALSLRDDPG